jgi:hypothetical protein
MMKFAVFTCLLALLGILPAAGDPTDLSGGVFIAHYVPAVQYTWDPPGDWCAAYEPLAIGSCEEQRTRIDTIEPLLVTWYILAAWTEEKEFCVTEVGVGDYSLEVFYPLDWNPCFPPGGGLEIPAGYFPHPMEGTAFIVLNQPWFGNFVEVYRITGYAYSGAGVVPLAVDPPTGFAGWANCLDLTTAYRAEQYGALGINTDGIAVCPADSSVSIDRVSWGTIKALYRQTRTAGLCHSSVLAQVISSEVLSRDDQAPVPRPQRPSQCKVV